jgi:hypothetical protein
MRELNINITRAQLVSYSVTLKDKKPEVTATIALLTDGGKTITTYSISTDAWDEKSKFDLPIEIMGHIGQTATVLEGVVVRHCNESQMSLPEQVA